MAGPCCGPMVCYKYEDCGPPLACLPRSAFKRNGLQDCQFFQQGSIRYLCRADCCSSRPCPPSCPPCVRCPAPGKTYKHKTDGAPRAGEDGEQKKSERENQLKRTKSRELRGGIMYYSCHCIKRNGLQHDCRRTGCGGEPACLVLPDPLCAPSQLARARGLADSKPLAAHIAAQGGGSSGGAAESGSGSGKRFIVCELKGILPNVATDSQGKCCKCPNTVVPTQSSKNNASPSIYYTTSPEPVKPLNAVGPSNCKCNCSARSGPSETTATIALDEKTINDILRSFESKEMGSRNKGVRNIYEDKTKLKEPEPCTRPGCMHWKPPPPCVWDMPCKADCFETPAGLQPGRNKLARGGLNTGETGISSSEGTSQRRNTMKVLTPDCCTGCSGQSGGGGAAAAGGPAGAMPLLVMKLC